MEKLQVTIMPSWRRGKKYAAVLDLPYTKVVHFGAEGYEDFTTHKDPIRMIRYIERHIHENWDFDNIESAAFWSRWLLWNRPDLVDAIHHIEQKFPVVITLST